MINLMGTLNEPYSRYLPKAIMMVRNNKIRGISMGVGFRVRRKWIWDDVAWTSIIPTFEKPNEHKYISFLKNSVYILAPISAWCCRDRIGANPLLSTGTVAIACGMGIWRALPTLRPLEVEQVTEDSAISNIVRVGDNIINVDGQSVSRKSAEEVQRLLDEGQQGDSVRITLIRRKKEPTNMEIEAEIANDKCFASLRGYCQRFGNDFRNILTGLHRSGTQTINLAPKVHLTQQLPHGLSENHIELFRDYLPAPSGVEWSVLNPKQCGGVGVGVLSLPEFTDETYYDFRGALDKLRAQFPVGKACCLEALVVDLRGNRGGPLVPALDIAALFLSKGTVLTQMRDGARVETHRSTNCHPDLNMSLLLLTDGRTASASEILVEALCDNQRASSMGWPTVGKNVAQVRTDVVSTSNHAILFNFLTINRPY